MHELVSKFHSADGALVAGVLSGTSADGIDVGVARIRARGAGSQLLPPELLSFSTEPFPADLRSRVRAVLDGEPCGLRDSALLSRDLGRAFGSVARSAARRARVELDLVGSHGQTVWHHDGREASGAATLQLGDGDFVAEEAGCAVVSDFRQRDIAAGGEGAPVSALADDAIFGALARPAAILNLGGMGNLTILGREDRAATPAERTTSELLAFDTGPANSLLDGLARRLLDAPCDRDGACAASGIADPRLLAELCGHPFLSKRPPKSTGRDTFGEIWVGEILELSRSRGLLEQGPAILMATATAFVAESVALALRRFVDASVDRLVVAGGGAHNRALVAALSARCPCRVETSDTVGVDPDAREALVFAVLAARCILGVPMTHPGATGARVGRVLGKISPRSPG
jgi:anhydro-N-acetylmuramic acid kinase